MRKEEHKERGTGLTQLPFQNFLFAWLLKNPNFMTAVTLKQSAESDSNPFHKENNEGLLNLKKP